MGIEFFFRALLQASLTLLLCSQLRPSSLPRAKRAARPEGAYPKPGRVGTAATTTMALQTNGHLSTDSVVSTSTSSSSEVGIGGSERPKRKLSSSSEPSLESEVRMLEGEVEDYPVEPPKKKRRKKNRPLFKMRLKLDWSVLRKGFDDAKPENESPPAASAAKESSTCGSTKENVHHNHHTEASTESCEQLSVQRLLFLASQRKLQAQAELTLPQLKQQARDRARANSVKKAALKAGRQAQQAKRKKRRSAFGIRKRKRRAPEPPPAAETEATLAAKEEEPTEMIKMNTGILYVYRGEKPRAKFVRRK